MRHTTTTGHTLFVKGEATCSAGYEVCEGGCIGTGADCCNDGTGEACEAGYYCIPGACCPKGEDCDDSDDEVVCDDGDVPCGEDYCMPLTGNCCSNQGYYCPDYGTCTSDGLCCAFGDNCEGGDTSTKEGYTSHTPTFAAQTTDNNHNGAINLLTAVLGSSDSSMMATQTPITVTVTPSPTAPRPGKAGGHYTADGRIVAGLAVVALFI